jgi:DNA-binding transcriptional MocR family regulator
MTATAPIRLSLGKSVKVSIDRGEFSEGGRLPAESELAARFGGVRARDRGAAVAIAREGIIVSRIDRFLADGAYDDGPTYDLLLAADKRCRSPR